MATPSPGPAAPPAPSAPAEDYLKAVYACERVSGSASTSDLAAALQVAPASVTGMVRKLAAQGYLDHVPYRGVQLTPRGRTVALRTIRRHRVLESYLTTVLGVPWDRVHDEAERLEHAASDDLVERMAAALGHPSADPHGAPIPAADGTIAERQLGTLADLPTGATARVVMVSDRNPALLRYVAALAMHPGTLVTVVARAPFGGPLTLRLGEREEQVGPALAAQLVVEEAVPEPLPAADDSCGVDATGVP
jgi:DtxR family Mn-dependent transcriptional regulator